MVPDCIFATKSAYSLDMVDASTVPIAITVTGSDVEIETSDYNLAGTYQLSIQRQVTDGTGATKSDQLTFEVQLIVDCTATTITPVAPLNTVSVTYGLSTT